MTYRVEPLDDHELDSFQCGVDELDEWLIYHARTATGQGTRTYVLVDEDASVVGYFAITPHLLRREEAPARVARGVPREIPAILLAKLAVDRSRQGSGLGSEMLVSAIGTIVDAARRAGGRLIVVDAINDQARSFYEHHDFQPLPDNDRRLVIKISTAAQALGIDWP